MPLTHRGVQRASCPRSRELFDELQPRKSFWEKYQFNLNKDITQWLRSAVFARSRRSGQDGRAPGKGFVLSEGDKESSSSGEARLAPRLVRRPGDLTNTFV
jgi:hypothetical protein